MHRLDFNEEMVLLAENRWRATHRANWIDQVRSGVARATFVAIVAVLIVGLALWASTCDKSVGQRLSRSRVQKLCDLPLDNQVFFLQCLPDLLTEFAIVWAVRATVIVEFNMEPAEIPFVFGLNCGDKVAFGNTSLPSAFHDRCTVCVVGTEVDAAVSPQFLEPHPDICLDVFHEVADVNRPVRVGKCGSDENPSLAHAGSAGHRDRK